MNIPFSYDQINLAAGFNKPATQKSYNNQTYSYWARALFQRAAYAIELTLPDEWETDLKGLFYYWLYSRGYLGIYNEPEMGTVFQPGTLSGYDFYYRPVRFIVTNPYAPEGGSSRELTIGKDCALIKLAPDYIGIWDVIDYYARKLSDLSLSIDMSIINTRFAKIMGARNKAAAETLKKILDKINMGQPAVITDDKLLDDRTDKASPFQEFGIDHLKENYITDEQLRDLQTIMNAFDNEIGIPTVPYQKAERMVVSEAESRQVESIARVTVWVETLNSCFKTANEMFGLNLKAAVRERRTDNGNNEPVIDGAV